MQAIIIQILIRVGSAVLINLLRAGADELEKRKDNDFSESNKIKEVLNGVNISGKNS